MKISLNWLKEYLEFDLSAEATAIYLTDCGLEVEGIEEFETVKGGLRGLVIGEVLTCEPHPDSDHLHLTTVRIGTGEPLHIVCGAPNVKSGQKVVVATIGTTLYNGDESFVIKKSKIRGALSEGMLCAEDEIGIGTSHEGIMVLPDAAQPGTMAADYFSIEKDFIFEIGLTPNRSDAMSHLGVARDLYAVFNAHQVKCSTLIFPQSSDFIPVHTGNRIDITVENTKDCPRYTGMTFENVTVKESPDWLKNRLRSIGIRPVNNIVDITQFVMFEMGQPLHVFDADYIKGGKVIVKNLPEGTPFTTLDGNKIELNSEDLMICNAEEGMCIAGVYGGLESGVTENTTRLFLESAYFNPVSIRKTSKRHHLKTDAAFRYERGTDPEITVRAIRRAATLIQELSGAIITSEVMDVYPTVLEPYKVKLSFDEINRIAGKEIDKNVVTSILLWLGMEVDTAGEDQILVRVPRSRVDVTRAVDVIEEILRIYGYNHIDIPAQIHYFLSDTHRKTANRWKNVISDYLVANGFYEVINNPLTKEAYVGKFDFIDPAETVSLCNPLSRELNVMRQTLLFSGLENIAYNFHNKNISLKLFEFGNIYRKNIHASSEDVSEKYKEEPRLTLFLTGKISAEQWNRPSRDMDFFDLKNMITTILSKINFPVSDMIYSVTEDSLFIKGISCHVNDHLVLRAGEVHPVILKYFDIKKPVFYAEFISEMLDLWADKYPVYYTAIPPFPEVKRDLALVVDKHVSYQKLEEIAFKYGSKLLKHVNLFDVYEGDAIPADKKSYALNFVLQHSEKTLTDQEINKLMNKLIDAYKREANAQLR